VPWSVAAVSPWPDKDRTHVPYLPNPAGRGGWSPNQTVYVIGSGPGRILWLTTHAPRANVEVPSGQQMHIRFESGREETLTRDQFVTVYPSKREADKAETARKAARKWHARIDKLMLRMGLTDSDLRANALAFYAKLFATMKEVQEIEAWLAKQSTVFTSERLMGIFEYCARDAVPLLPTLKSWIRRSGPPPLSRHERKIFNTASFFELAALKGAEAVVRAILSSRDEGGPFHEIDDLIARTCRQGALTIAEVVSSIQTMRLVLKERHGLADPRLLGPSA